MEDSTSQWWLLTIQGIAAILFGLAAVFWPGLSLVVLVYLFGAYILVMGMISLISSFLSIGKGQAWILTLLLGVLELGVGVYLIRHPHVSFSLLVLLIGFSFIVSAVVEAISALAEPNQSTTLRVLKLVGAALSLVVGVFILNQPITGGVTFVWVLGLIALINGPISIALSMDVKKAQEQAAAKVAKA